MKSLCITGSVQSTLDQLAEALLKAGAKAAVPALRNQKVSIAQWHQNALAAQTGSSFLAPLELDRVWDQLALDIFYANQSHPVWFWADENSIHLLDYWLGFDPNTHFVLVHTSPQEELIGALNEGKETLLALETVLQEWCLRTQAMLRFHLRYPTRSVFVDSHLAANQPGSYLQAMAEHWQLPLQPTEVQGTKNVPDQHLDIYIIRHLLHRHPSAAELHNEVQARLIMSADHTITPNPVLDQVIADHLARKRGLLGLQFANHTLERRLQIKEKEMQAIEQEKQKALSNLSELHVGFSQEKIALQTHVNNLSRSHKRQERKVTHAHNHTLAENAALLHELHHTQEAFEANLALRILERQQLECLQGRLKNVLNKFPDYWELEAIDIKPIKTKTKTKTKILQWHINNVYLDDLKFRELRFQTHLTNGIAGIVFQRPLKGGAPWPKALLDKEELSCLPTQGTAYQGDNYTISRLGISDWKYVNILVTKLIALLSDASFIQFPASVDKGALKNGLSTLAGTLINWPMVLRYDDVQLSESTKGNEYQCIGIKFKNLSLGNIEAPEFNYRIATVDESTASFGQHPRIEFPESNQNLLQNWFIESNDERGARLELRFSKPDAMDTHVWNLLGEKDRILISGLVSTLPFQLGELQCSNPDVNIPWGDWHALSLSVKDILSSHVSVPKH